MPESTQNSAVYIFGAFELSIQSGELRKHGIRLRLPGQSVQVLATLLERSGDVVTREELHAKLWPVDTFVNFDHGLNNAVARIREVLDDSSDKPRYVETIPRRGYRFIAPMTVARATAAGRPVNEAAVSTAAAANSSVGSLVSSSPPAVVPPLAGGAGSSKFWLLLAPVILSVVFVAGYLTLRRSATVASRPAIKSLAVLPLRNLSMDAKQDYLADGMTEELIGRLAGIRDLRVISRTSVMRFKETKLSATEIAKTLGVDTLVEGSIIREGNRIRVHAQLIRGETDEHFWSEAYDRDIGDLLGLQSEVAQAIAKKVEATITGQEKALLVAARQVSPEVYESYVKGRFGAHNNRVELEESVAYFQQAIKQDPTFAPAYLGLAETYENLSLILVGAPPSEMRPKVVAAAKKALELDPELAEAHTVLAEVYQRQWKWSEAESEYKQALQLKPNEAAAHVGLANWLLCQGRVEEALAWAQRARELDPLGTVGISIGWILFNSHRYDEAVRELRSVLAVRPDAAMARWYLGFALIGKGQPLQALAELERTVILMERSPGSLELLATAEARAGHRAEALRILREMKGRRQSGYFPAGAFINPYLALGNYDEAFLWFDQACAEQSGILQFLKVQPFFDPVRTDPRFDALLRRVGLK